MWYHAAAIADGMVLTFPICLSLLKSGNARSRSLIEEEAGLARLTESPHVSRNLNIYRTHTVKPVEFVRF